MTGSFSVVMAVDVGNSALKVRMLAELGGTGCGSSVLFGVSLLDPAALYNNSGTVTLKYS